MEAEVWARLRNRAVRVVRVYRDGERAAVAEVATTSQVDSAAETVLTVGQPELE